MQISIGSDHAGVSLKRDIINKIKSITKESGIEEIEFIDVGTNTEDSCDYPDYISKAAFLVRDGKAALGIAICGTGIGASMVANKVKGIRAALCFNEFMAEMSRRHNNANMLVLGARVIGIDLALRIVDTWLKSPFDGDRHQRRLDKITRLENEFC